MLGRLLVANRGEIARRIVRTCRRLGVGTVAVHSALDAGEPHTREADVAVPIGPAPAAESYLVIDRIVEVARRHGCDAVHPGYGFLAENAAFADAVRDAGLMFVGPSSDVLRLLGDKAAAKRHLADAGVPVIRGVDADDLDDDALVSAAASVGAPLLVKAVAGGGGKGMREVHDLARLPDAIAAARREAQAAFGDGRLILERLVASPRHVEVQIIADQAGTVLHLGERECSVQRRHQKLVEETPAPCVDDALRARMTDAAVTAARSVGYEGAGTVEFLVAGDTLDQEDPEFAFLEVNTRLQVEHPVTEFVSGLDLVELQLRVAAGESLPFRQDEVQANGHAIEVRLCAEDAVTHLPKTGSVLRFEAPEWPGTRIDSGIEAGSTVTTHYDPLVAKLIAHGADRAGALARLRELLASTIVHGVETNRDLLAAVLAHPSFEAGELTTGFLADHLGDFAPPPTPDAAWLAAAVHLRQAARRNDGTPWQRLGPRRPTGAGGWPILLDDGQRTRVVQVRDDANGYRLALDGGAVTDPVAEAGDDGSLDLEVDGTRQGATVTLERTETGEAVWVHVAGLTRRLVVHPATRAADPATITGHGEFGSPMPGTVLSVEVAAGDRVASGTTLVVVEAMKMEHAIAAPTDGVVTDVHVAAGDAVEAGSPLLAFRADSDRPDGDGTTVGRRHDSPADPDRAHGTDG